MSALDAPARPLPAFRRRPLTPVQRTQRTVGYVLIVLLALFCLGWSSTGEIAFANATTSWSQSLVHNMDSPRNWIERLTGGDCAGRSKCSAPLRSRTTGRRGPGLPPLLDGRSRP